MIRFENTSTTSGWLGPRQAERRRARIPSLTAALVAGVVIGLGQPAKLAAETRVQICGPTVVNWTELARPQTPAGPAAQSPPPSSTPAKSPGLGPLLSLAGSRTATLAGLQPMSAGYTPALRASFAAVADNPAINAFPPDTIGAVGLEHLVVALNSEVAMMSRQGQGLSKAPLASFWKSQGHKFHFDPKVIYDHLANRWLFVTLADPRTTNSALLVAASRSSDPTQNWFIYNIPAIPPPNPTSTNPPPQVWLDYPNLGYNQQWFVATVNRTFLNSTNQSEAGSTATIFAFDKAGLYAGATQPAVTVLQDPQFTVVPAVCFDNNPTNFYLVTEAATVQEGIVSQLRISQIQGTVGHEVYLTNVALTPPAPQWNFSPGETNFAAQLGTTNKIFANDSRLQSCVLRQGSLWCIQHIFLPAGAETNVTRCAVQWWQLGTNGTIVQRGRIDDPAGKTNYIFPSLAVNRSSAVLIGYTRVASDQYASAAFSYQMPGDAPNSLRGETVFKAGLAPYSKSASDGQNRWGDFSGTVVDPMNDVDMWTLQEYAELPQNTTNRWGTWWGCVGFQPQAPPVFVQGPLTQPVWTFGTNVTLTNLLTGTSPFTYQWLFNGTNLPWATNATLVLTNFQPTNVGLYSVLASNVAGFARSAPGSLTAVPVDIASSPASQIVRVGSDATFTVTATGTQPFFYHWLHQGTNISGATNDTLTISSSQTNDQGNYSVVISNLVSSITSPPVSLTVVPILPAKLSQFKVLADGSTQMFITCETNVTMTIQYATDLTLKDWTELIPPFLTTSTAVQFKDPSASGDPRRFYRVLLTR